MNDRRRTVLGSLIILVGVGTLVYSMLLFLEAFAGRPAHHFWIAAAIGAALVIGGSGLGFVGKGK